ncbi:hypothetical protein BDM02DRAFT_3192215 [Thelephora ganbajun]|uniref:Uncharacterized protein n=1 Tax=Thelephora ganbajun TaxID=370292 RepID=A0ACB6Z0T7_THEGA|nr:hypothetical protein BDM02DRAFT_3192215 [Thelephora ganbajun]
MTLENNQTFISPHNQRITHIDAWPHRKNGSATADSYGFEYPTFASLIDTVITQEDNEFPCRQYASGCSFDDIIWQQAIGACKNMDHNHHGHNMGDEEKVLFDLVSMGIIDHQEFDKPHKWSSHSIRYSAVVADCLWALFEAECSRNDRLEQDLNALKGQVALLNTRLLAMDHYLFEANNKVNNKLKKDGERFNCHHGCVNLLQEKHNGLVLFVTNLSDQLDLHHHSLISLQGGVCTCNPAESPIGGSGATPSFLHSPPLSPAIDPTPPLSGHSSPIAHRHKRG